MDRVAVRVLKKARGLIADPANFCTSAYARNVHGDKVGSRNPDAVQFCAIGAITRASDGVLGHRSSHVFLYQAAESMVHSPAAADSVVEVNDCDGHAAVIGMYDRAIRLAEAA